MQKERKHKIALLYLRWAIKKMCVAARYCPDLTAQNMGVDVEEVHAVFTEIEAGKDPTKNRTAERAGMIAWAAFKYMYAYMEPFKTSILRRTAGNLAAAWGIRTEEALEFLGEAIIELTRETLAGKKFWLQGNRKRKVRA